MSYQKYRAKAVVVDGVRFPSKAQAARYLELRYLERAGEIRLLKLEVPFTLSINGVKICRYVADFTYDEKRECGWVPVVEDTKGFKTQVYKLKAKLMLAVLGIEIRETMGRKPKGRARKS